MGRFYFFNDYSKKITFLQKILQQIASKLTVEEFSFPDEAVEQARRELERAFGQYVMSYNAKVFRKDIPLVSHLCANDNGAVLTDVQTELLSLYEKKFQSRNVRFVVYQNPLTKISIQQSPFFN